MKKNLLEVSNLKVSFRNGREFLEVIRGFDTEIPTGSIVGILGESGSGKTVSVKSLIGLLDDRLALVDSGSAVFDGQDLLTMNESELRGIRGRRISYIFQDPARALNPHLSVGRQIEQTLICHGITQPREKTLDFMKSVGLDNPESFYHRRPAQLSGGQCQRVTIAQAIATRPELIIADEPTSSIDASIQRTILDLFVKLNSKLGTTIIIISHNFDVIRYLCDSVIVMYGGLVMESGQIDQIMVSPAHPYTREIIRCAESLSSSDKVLYSLKGRPPTVKEFDDSCPFLNRCDFSIPDCDQKIPPTTQYRDRNIRCFNPLEEGDDR